MAHGTTGVQPRNAALCALLTAGSGALATGQSGWLARSTLPAPSVRGWHALTFDWSRFVTVVFGGWDGAALGDTWEWDGSAWTQRNPATAPAPRCCHALAFDLFRSRVVVFGGTSDAVADLDDTWEYDGTNWQQVLPTNRPGPRREVKMAFDSVSGRMLLFGGGRGGSGSPVFNDTWLWDGTNWQQQLPGTTPPARWSQTMTSDFVAGGVYMFGGAVGGINALNDAWVWNGLDWQPRTYAASPPPLTRSGIAQDLGTGNIALFGGNTGTTTWILSGGSWVADNRAGAPRARASFAMASDIVRSRAILFGGYDNGIYLGDTWEYDSSGVAMWRPYGSACPGTFGSPLLQPAPGSRPAAGQSLVLDVLTAGAGPAAVTLGFSDTQWAGGTLPFDLTPLGMSGCTMFASPDVLAFLPVVAGRAQWSLGVPNAVSLMGAVFVNQAVVVDVAANPFGAVVSNAGRGVVGI